MKSEELVSALEELGIDIEAPDPDVSIEDAVGIDSQEATELRDIIRERYGADLTIEDLSKDTLVRDLLRKSDIATTIGSKQMDYQDQCTAEAVFEFPAEVVYDALHRFDRWAELLPHVEQIDTVYDDGRFQEFFMSVVSDNGTVHVRSVRRCDDNTIDFFQPKPPVFLTHHAGRWLIEPLDNGRCRVTTSHMWTLDEDGARTHFADAADPAAAAHETLLGHAEFALQSWQNILAEQSVQSAAG